MLNADNLHGSASPPSALFQAASARGVGGNTPSQTFDGVENSTF